MLKKIFQPVIVVRRAGLFRSVFSGCWA